jgi:hypothetical protein
MEGSMKMMSWSRYHCLSPSLLRAERRCRALKSRSKLRKIWRRSPARHPRPPVPRVENGLVRYLARYFQFVIQLFRT